MSFTKCISVESSIFFPWCPFKVCVKAVIQTLDSLVLKKKKRERIKSHKSFQWVESAVFFPQDINLSKSILTLLHCYHLIAVITSCSLLSGVTGIKWFSFFVIEVPKKDSLQEAITDKRKHMSSGLYSCVCKDRHSRCAHKHSHQ